MKCLGLLLFAILGFPFTAQPVMAQRAPSFPSGRIVDLSAAAARVLGLSGIGKVRLEAVRESDPELAIALLSELRTPTLLQPINQ